jgi:hypothetical protein
MGVHFIIPGFVRRRMKKLLSIAVCFMFVGAANAFAAPLEKQKWELGIQVSDITYKEPGVMKQEGLMYGLLCSYAYHSDSNVMFGIGLGLSLGKVDYSSPASGDMDNIPDWMAEFRLLGGRDFSASEASFLTPYTGIGYRYLNDDSSGMTSTTGAYGYERESNYFYIPIGIEASIGLENDWSVGVILEYDLFCGGLQISHLSDVDPNYNNPENAQKGGYGIRWSAKFRKKGEWVDFVIEPFIRYWNIEKSEDADITYGGVYWGSGYEPKNNSTELGITLAIGF